MRLHYATCSMILLLVGSLFLSFPALGQPELVILVRHAERAAEPAGDPNLSEAGQRRARALKEALRHAGITTVVATEYRRTRETAAPIAEAMGLETEVIGAAGRPLAEHVAEVATRARQAEGNVLVVGHSNTVGPLLAALGGPEVLPICENRFGNLLVLQMTPSPARVLHLHYGDEDPPAGENCR